MVMVLCTHDENECSCVDCTTCGDGICHATEAGDDSCAADCTAGWVRICAGTFMMGSPVTEEGREPGAMRETLHEVTLTHDFEILSTEVTQTNFAALLGYNPSQFVACGGDCPVEMIAWHEAAAYCNELSTTAGFGECYDCTGDGDAVDLRTQRSLRSSIRLPGIPSARRGRIRVCDPGRYNDGDIQRGP